MADKKISQLVERLVTAATDVFPVVFVGSTETQKVKASTIFAYIKTTLTSGIIQAVTDTDKFLVLDGTEIKYRTGAETLNDVLPTQTGNAGYVLKTDGTIATWQPDAGSTTPIVAIPFSTDHLNATGNQYLIGDVVYYAGNVYRCIADNDSIIPTNASYWVSLGAGYPLVERPIDWNATTGNNQILNKPTIPTTPTLQQVTTAGANTNIVIELENGFDIYDPTNLQWIEVRGGDNFISAKIQGAASDFFVAEVGSIAIKDGINKVALITLSNIPASTTKNFALPNIGGSSATLVTSVNGVSASTTGDVTIPTGVNLTLQDVTDNGNTTTNQIDITNANGVGVYDSSASTYYRLIGNGGSFQITNGIAQFFAANLNQIVIGQLNAATIDRTLLTAPRTLQLPNANGTFVLSVNGVTPNTSGQITIPVGGTQTLDQTTALGNTSTTSIKVENGAEFQIENTTLSDDLRIYVSGNTINFEYASSGDRLFELDNGRLTWGNQNQTAVQFRTTNLSTGITLFEMPDDSGATLVTKVNGVSANAQGEITIPTGASLTLQQVTDNGNTTTNDIALIDASVTGIDTLDFDLTPATTTHSEGRVRWNDSDKTLQIDTEQSGVSISVGHDVIQRVVNNTGSTINKGSVVYINGQQGGRPTITLADNVSDATSATTFGVVMDAIPNNQNGYVINVGLLSGINTSTFTAGQQLYLGSSGALTGTKPTQPLHIVYVAKVISVGLLGSIFVNVQNGLELEELHDVLISSPTNGQVLTYETSTGLWKNQTPTSGGVTSVTASSPLASSGGTTPNISFTGILPIANGGTNASTAATALTNLLPSQTGNLGKFLYTDGTNASWNFPNRYYKLGFNNISDYVVNGFSGIQILGSGTLGMSLTFDLQTLLYSISGSNYVVKCKVITAEQYGGVANQLGLRVTYSSANGNFSFDQTSAATYIPQSFTNFALQSVDLTINIPTTYNGASTNFFRFEVAMQRNVGGSTSVYSSNLTFSV